MIVRILGEGQFLLDDDDIDALNQLDDLVEAAAAKGDADALSAALTKLLGAVREHGTPVDDDLLVDSDVILPDADASVEEVREWIGQDPSFDGVLPAGN